MSVYLYVNTTYFSPYLFLLFIAITLGSCTTYEYLHSAQGSDYSPYVAPQTRDSVTWSVEGGYLKGNGFNRLETRKDRASLNYGYAQVSAGKSFNWCDIAIGAKMFYGSHYDNRDSFLLQPFDGTEGRRVFNPLSGRRSLYGGTLGFDISLVPIGEKNTRYRWLGMTYRTSYDGGVYASDRIDAEYFGMEDSDTFLFRPYQSRWLHSFGMFQEYIITYDRTTQLIFGHQGTFAPLFMDDRDIIRGGWSIYTAFRYKHFMSTLQTSISENTHATFSLRYIF